MPDTHPMERGRRAARAAGLALVAGLVAACGSTGDPDGPGGPDPALGGPGVDPAGPGEAPPPPPEPWPGTFRRAALLVADQVAIEGPVGLLDHVALGQDDTRLDYAVETLPEGFRQVLTKKPGVDYVEIRAGLDAWEITALEQVLVIERPGAVGDVPVRVVAAGGVWWRSLDARGPLGGGLEERRGDRLTFLSD